MIEYTDEELNVVVTISDAREKGGCVRGWQTFVESKGFNWKEVVRKGMTVRELLSTNDYMAEELVKFKLSRGK